MVDRANIFAQSYKDLAQERATPTRPYEPVVPPPGSPGNPIVPEPGTPTKPSHLQPGFGAVYKGGKTPPIYVPPVEEHTTPIGATRPAAFAGNFSNAGQNQMEKMAAFRNSLANQYAGAQNGGQFTATINPANAAQGVRAGLMARRNPFARSMRGFQLGARRGRGGRIPVASPGDAYRQQKLASAMRAGRRAPFVNKMPGTTRGPARNLTPELRNQILLGML